MGRDQYDIQPHGSFRVDDAAGTGSDNSRVQERPAETRSDAEMLEDRNLNQPYPADRPTSQEDQT